MATMTGTDSVSQLVQMIMEEADLAFHALGIVKNDFVYHTVAVLARADDFDNVVRIKLTFHIYSQLVFKCFAFSPYMPPNDTQRALARRKMLILLSAMDLPGQSPEDAEGKF